MKISVGKTYFWLTWEDSIPDQKLSNLKCFHEMKIFILNLFTLGYNKSLVFWEGTHLTFLKIREKPKQNFFSGNEGDQLAYQTKSKYLRVLKTLPKVNKSCVRQSLQYWYHHKQ